tara:strand:+ start:8892 stop:9473 length:582 start_codon:yes stop_codon:yes gene_type:complete
MAQSFDIRTNQKQVVKSLGRKAKKHIPEATRWAINNTAKKLQKAYKVQTEKKLDRPTKFTTNGFFIKYARRNNLEAFVQVKDVVAKYLKWQIEGGVSTPSRPEAVPTENRKLNKYGNIPGRQLVKSNNIVRPTKKGMGVWTNPKKGTPKLLIAFKTSINYTKRFPFYKIGNNVIKNVFPKELKFSLRKEMRRK